MALRLKLRGEYRIDPPLKWSEIRNNPFLSPKDGGTGLHPVTLRLTAENQETDDALTTIITCSAVGPLMESPFDPGNLEKAVNELRAECEGLTVTG